MSYQESYPAYIAPVAFERLQPHYQAIRHDPGQMQEVANLVVEEHGHMDPIVVAEEAIIYRWVVIGPRFGRRMDTPVRDKKSAEAAYYPATALLRTDEYTRTPTVAGATLAASTSHRVREVGLSTKAPPLKAWVHSMLYPPAEDQRLIASPLAWARQAGEAAHATTNLTEAKKSRLVGSILLNFPGAIVLAERPDALPGRRLPIES